MNNKHLFIGLHIPKTAGTTLLYILQKNLSKHSLHQTTSLIKNAKLGISFVEEMKYLDDISTIFGHEVDAKTICYFPNKSIYLFTFIREPISRLISYFNYSQRLFASQGRGEIHIEDFIKANRNQMCRFIINRFHDFLSLDDKKSLMPHEKAIKILQSFDFVGTTEHFDSSVELLLDDMNLSSYSYTGKKKNVAKKSVNILENNIDIDIDMIQSQNSEDYKLYEHFLYNLSNSNLDSKFVKNPFGFRKEQKKQCIDKMLAIKLDENQRLRYLYTKAAREYRNHHQLEKFIEEQKQVILRNALKLDCMLSCLDEKSTISTQPEFFNQVVEIVDKEN